MRRKSDREELIRRVIRVWEQSFQNYRAEFPERDDARLRSAERWFSNTLDRMVEVLSEYDIQRKNQRGKWWRFGR